MVAETKNMAVGPGRKLLLGKRDRSGLLQESNGSYVEGVLGNDGELYVNEITKEGTYGLPLEGVTATEFLKYFVLPEMEVERILNCVRYKYLKAIYISNIQDPSRLISSQHNKAFKALSGLRVWQGDSPERKNNDYFWQKEGFSQEAKDQLDWQKERDELEIVISLIKLMYKNNLSGVYKELIAIKPGLHEICIHDNYFDSNIEVDRSPRNEVFNMLRGKERELQLDVLPNEINKNSYFSYAPCHVTEGPFVFRKSLDVSYFNEIRKIQSENDLHKLQKKFHILNYFTPRIDSREKLNNFLEKAKNFRSFR